MATIVKTSSGTWKALIRKTGWPATAKTFRTKRDAEDWARRTEDEMLGGLWLRDPLALYGVEDVKLAPGCQTPNSPKNDRKKENQWPRHLKPTIN